MNLPGLRSRKGVKTRNHFILRDQWTGCLQIRKENLRRSWPALRMVQPYSPTEKRLD